ncbi:hypothetical protein [Bacillus weihaiensis]|nr:hypothetical protein [Bacillus weihaiensis]
MSDWNEQAAPNNNLPAKNARKLHAKLNRENVYTRKDKKRNE